MWGEVCVMGLARVAAGTSLGVQVCRLCGAEAVEVVALNESVALQHSYCSPSMTLAEILTALTHRPLEESSVLPGVVCAACTRAAITSLMFLRLCDESERCWQKICSDINQCMDNELLGNRKVESVYIFLNSEEPKVLVDKQTVPAQVAFRRANVLVRNEQNRIRARCKSEQSGRRYYQCEDCGKLVKNKYLFEKHIAIHSQHLQCMECGKMCKSRPRLNVHIARVHSEKKHQCTICDKKFGSEYLALEHRRAMHKQDSCRLCGKTYGSKSSLRAHEESHKVWACEKCGKSYRYKQSLKTHMCLKSDEPQELFVCAYCSRGYSAKSSLRTHIKLEHISNPNTCHLCKKKFHSASRLRDHAAVHTGMKNHLCPFCEGTFMSQATLARHVRAAHTGERPYECGDCGASFVSSHRRMEHMRRCHDAPAPTCRVCRARFATHHDLRVHLRKHFQPTSKLYCRDLTIDSSTELTSCDFGILS